jgi:iron complex transport system ATP-binding protein
MLIETTNLGFRFGDRPFLWRGIAFTLNAGNILAVLGPNGVGKTTLIKCLAGLLPPTEGKAYRAGAIGYVPQATQLAFSYPVRDVVAMGRARHLGLLGVLKARDRDAISAAIEQSGISDLAEREFTQLSGGERQLALIARALASESKIILLDEPMSSLDLRNQRRVLELFGNLAKLHSVAVVFTTHNPEHAFRVASSVLLIGADLPHAFGPMPDCLSENALSQLYGVDMRIVDIVGNAGTTRHAVPIL